MSAGALSLAGQSPTPIFLPLLTPSLPPGLPQPQTYSEGGENKTPKRAWYLHHKGWALPLAVGQQVEIKWVVSQRVLYVVEAKLLIREMNFQLPGQKNMQGCGPSCFARNQAGNHPCFKSISRTTLYWDSIFSGHTLSLTFTFLLLEYLEIESLSPECTYTQKSRSVITTIFQYWVNSIVPWELCEWSVQGLPRTVQVMLRGG